MSFKSRRKERKAKHAANKSRRKGRKLKRKTLREDKREEGAERRIEGRRRRAARRYGKFHPHANDALDTLAPLQDAMADDLTEKGVPLNDPDDTVEVATKFAEHNDDIDDSVDADDLDAAYNNEDSEGDEDNFDHVEKAGLKAGAMNALKAALGSVGNDVSNHIDKLAQTKASGGQLTKSQQQLLDASNDAHDAVKTKVIGDITDTLKDLAPVLIGITVLGIVIYKLG